MDVNFAGGYILTQTTHIDSIMRVVRTGKKESIHRKGNMKAEIAEMDKCIKCLALELPEAIHSEVVRIWSNLKDSIPGRFAFHGCGGDDSEYKDAPEGEGKK